MHIPCRGKLLPVNDANKAELRNKYSEVELVIIDEISVISSKLFHQIRKHLNKIFSLGQDVPFGENLFWFVETCVSYHQFVQNLYLFLMILKQWKDL